MSKEWSVELFDNKTYEIEVKLFIFEIRIGEGTLLHILNRDYPHMSVISMSAE